MKKDDIVFCTSGGCAAKLGPKTLEKVLKKLPKPNDPNLLVGFDSSDDASVYKINDEVAIVNTLDFFPPMIDDPYTFGQIAAANALSDIYAMGAQVLTCLNIVCFPKEWDLNILGQILQGGADKVVQAGGVLVGGHSINDTSVKYGLSCSGIVNVNKILKNNTPKENDKLILTKALGVGIIFSANKSKIASKEAVDKAVLQMVRLNKDASEVIRNYDISCCTDVTGFGLLGHLNEMVGDNYSAVLDSKNIPILEEALTYVKQNIVTNASSKLKENVKNRIQVNIDDKDLLELFYDPQTSGGLLFSANEKDVDNIIKDLNDKNIDARIIGEIVKKKEKSIYIN